MRKSRSYYCLIFLVIAFWFLSLDVASANPQYSCNIPNEPLVEGEIIELAKKSRVRKWDRAYQNQLRDRLQVVLRRVKSPTHLARIAVWASFLLNDKTLDELLMVQTISESIYCLGSFTGPNALKALDEISQQVTLDGQLAAAFHSSARKITGRSVIGQYKVRAGFPGLHFSYPLPADLVERCIGCRVELWKNWNLPKGLILDDMVSAEFVLKSDGEVAIGEIAIPNSCKLDQRSKELVKQAVFKAIRSCRTAKKGAGSQIKVVATFSSFR